MNEFISASPVQQALLWLVLAMVLALVEAFSISFGFILAGASALVAATLAALGASFTVQILVFALVTVLTLFLVRPLFLKRLHATPALPGRTDLLIGQTGVVTMPAVVEGELGRVSVGGEDWAARLPLSEQRGSKVIITGADGIVLHVRSLAPGENS